MSGYVSKKIAAKGGGSVVSVCWAVSKEIVIWIGNIQAIRDLAIKFGVVDKDAPMNPPEIVLQWWFPYATVTTGIIILLIIWRRELAPLLAREHLLPGWRFWDKFLPSIVFAERRNLDGLRRIHVLIERGRKIRDKTPHDPNDERKEWIRYVYSALEKYFPLKASAFMAVHGDQWDTKGHRQILDDEIRWLERLLNS